MTEPTEYIVVCCHSTRRTRKQAPGSREVSCALCRATILVNPLTDAWQAQRGFTFHHVCTACTAQIADIDALPHAVIPGTAEYLESLGIADGEEFMRAHRRPVREMAATALRNTVGGVG